MPIDHIVPFPLCMLELNIDMGHRVINSYHTLECHAVCVQDICSRELYVLMALEMGQLPFRVTTVVRL